MGIGVGLLDFAAGAADKVGQLIDYSMTSKLQATADAAKEKRLSELRKGEIREEYKQRMEQDRRNNSSLLDRTIQQGQDRLATENAKAVEKARQNQINLEARAREGALNRRSNEGIAAGYAASRNTPRPSVRETGEAVKGLFKWMVPNGSQDEDIPPWLRKPPQE